MCDTMSGHEPNGERQPQDPPSPFGGPGGLFGERPPVDASDEELDAWVEKNYIRRMATFVDLVRDPKMRRRRLHDYTAKNCEEAYGG